MPTTPLPDLPSADGPPSGPPPRRSPDARPGPSPSRGDAMAAADGAAEKMIAEIGAQAPVPTEVIPFSDIQNLVDALNAATAYLADGNMTPITYTPEGDASGGTKAQLPPEVFAFTVALGGAIGKLAEATPAFAEMTYDPMDVATRAGMQEITGKLAMAARNPDLKAAAREMTGGPPDDVRHPYGDMSGPPPGAA